MERADREKLAEARRALNAGGDLVRVLWGVWHRLDGGSEHSMAPYKLERATNLRWRDPFATFEIQRHGEPAGQIQFWRVDLAHGSATCVQERQLRVTAAPLERDHESALAAELASLIQAGGSDPRLRWENEQRREVKVLATAALGGGATSVQAKRLIDAVAGELGRGWVRERGVFCRRMTDEDRATVQKPPPGSAKPPNISTPGVQKPGNQPDGRDAPDSSEKR